MALKKSVVSNATKDFPPLNFDYKKKSYTFWLIVINSFRNKYLIIKWLSQL